MSMNYLAVVLAALAAFLFGAVYYRTLSKHWLKASGVQRSQVQGHPASLYITTIVAELGMAFMLAGLIAHLGPVNVRGGMVTAAHVWVAFVVTVIAVNNAFGMRPAMLTIIDSGHWLGVLLIMGAVIGAFGS